ncbi:MAG: hypothetical protein KDA57_17480 [Planctomycetales bacterium]|nr:hypothetical protein [Planctomycetales bacterium]
MAASPTAQSAKLLKSLHLPTSDHSDYAKISDSLRATVDAGWSRPTYHNETAILDGQVTRIFHSLDL